MLTPTLDDRIENAKDLIRYYAREIQKQEALLVMLESLRREAA